MYLVLDLSDSLLIRDDFKVKREVLVEEMAILFVKEYFDQNPLSQLGLIITKNSVAEKLCDFTGNSKNLIKIIKKNIKGSGSPSIQNSLGKIKFF
jgi:transcription initiation factor TFIIH subunit 2